MPSKKKATVEPTRRSTRTASQSKPSAPPATAKPEKKRAIDKVVTETEAATAKTKKAKKGLDVGDQLPDVMLLDEEGEEVKIADITAEKGIILFAYPKASTPGCIKQVCILFLIVGRDGNTVVGLRVPGYFRTGVGEGVPCLWYLDGCTESE
jgi:AhpC/TSA family